MKYFKKLEGPNLILAPMMMEDAPTYVKWLNDYRVTDGIGKTKDVTTIENEIEYLQNITKEGKYNFCIVTKDKEELIGSCSIMNIDQINQTAELGILIGEESKRGKGYGQEALKIMLDYGFNTLNLHNIYLGAYSFNEQAIACYKKVGFKEAGRLREAKFYNGKRYDDIKMDILRDEFYENNSLQS